LPSQESSGSPDLESDIPGSLECDHAALAKAGAETAAAMPSAAGKIFAAERHEMNFVIPGVSRQPTQFAALSENSDVRERTEPDDSRDFSSHQQTLLRAGLSVAETRATVKSDSEFSSKLRNLLAEAASGQHPVQGPHASVPRWSNPTAQFGGANGKRDGEDLVGRFEHLQRAVRDLAATVSSQAARHREESQAQRRERKTPPPQRTVVIKRAEALSTTPRAFWERSRLGPFYLRTRR
jgi:hypothetical protein